MIVFWYGTVMSYDSEWKSSSPTSSQDCILYETNWNFTVQANNIIKMQ